MRPGSKYNGAKRLPLALPHPRKPSNLFQMTSIPRRHLSSFDCRVHACVFRRTRQPAITPAYHPCRLQSKISMLPGAPQIVLIVIAQKMLVRAAPPPDWGLTAEQFQIALERSAMQRFSAATPAQNVVEKYLEGLNLSDLALACACSAGNSAAWDYFVATFRPELYRAARAVVSGSGASSDAAESGARELADSLYSDLYGLRESGGQRKSLFDYFHGRSKLTTWLRAILAQRHVDQFRRTRLLDPLDESGTEESSQPIAATTTSSFTPDTERER